MKKHRPYWFYIVIVTLLFVIGIVTAYSNTINTYRDAQRVKSIINSNHEKAAKLFRTKGMTYPADRIFIRILKYEREIELWAKSETDSVYSHIVTYKMTGYSGKLGPKRKQGDRQIPEGFYLIDRFNPWSNFHLSLGINYPNKSDRILKSGGNPGGDIFIHGGKVTIGCVPIGDEAIEQLYTISLEIYSNGGKDIQVHIFPCRMDDISNNYMLKTKSFGKAKLSKFWDNIKTGYEYFQKHKKLPSYTINSSGAYKFNISP